MLSPEEMFFFAGKPAEETLYAVLKQRMEKDLPDHCLRVMKTQITFVNPAVFACVSVKWKGCLTVTFGLPARLESPRVRMTAEVRPGRWTIHVNVSTDSEIDEELIGWLEAAYTFSQRNKTPA